MLHICIISGGQGTTVGGSHAGDALGKALASVRTHIPPQLVQPKLVYTLSSRGGTFVSIARFAYSNFRHFFHVTNY